MENMANVTCETCAAEFTAKRSDRKYCDTCRAKRIHDYQRDYQKQYHEAKKPEHLRGLTPEQVRAQTNEKLSEASRRAWADGKLNSDGLALGRIRTKEQRSAVWTDEKRAAQAAKTLSAYQDGRMTVHGRYRGVWTLYDGPRGQVNMRSKSEALFATHLDEMGIDWQYEPKRFDLGWATYCPDFYLPEFDRWIEVKGSWSEASRRKFDEFGQTRCISAVLAQDILKFAGLSADSFAEGKVKVAVTSNEEVTAW